MKQEFDINFKSSTNSKPNPIISLSYDFWKSYKSFIKTGLVITLGGYLFIQGVSYVFSDSPEEIKTYQLQLDNKYNNIQNIINHISSQKNYYDDEVKFLISKEYELKSNSLTTINNHVNKLEQYNSSWKSDLTDAIDKIVIIQKKYKEDKKSLTSDEVEFLEKYYNNYKNNVVYKDNNLLNLISELSEPVDIQSRNQVDDHNDETVQNFRKSIKNDILNMRSFKINSDSNHLNTNNVNVNSNTNSITDTEKSNKPTSPKIN